jgi:hypothetical protein
MSRSEHLLQVGLEGKASLPVESRHTAKSVKSGSLDVLATPMVIAVVEEAQFRGLNVRFWHDDATRTITMRVASTPDGAAEINLANGNAFHVLDALRLSDDNCGSMPIGQLRETLGRPYVRRDLGRLDGRYLERFDSLAAQADTSDGIRMVWG